MFYNLINISVKHHFHLLQVMFMIHRYVKIQHIFQWMIQHGSVENV
jgi:hypothetical protein